MATLEAFKTAVKEFNSAKEELKKQTDIVNRAANALSATVTGLQASAHTPVTVILPALEGDMPTNPQLQQLVKVAIEARKKLIHVHSTLSEEDKAIVRMPV